MSDALRLLLKNLMDSWEAAVKKTSTPIDDFIVKLIRGILAI